MHLHGVPDHVRVHQPAWWRLFLGPGPGGGSLATETRRPGPGQYQGHVSNVQVDVSKWLRKLPPKPDELGIVLVKRRTRGALGGAARPPFRIRPYVIYQAILRLRQEQQGMGRRAGGGAGLLTGGSQTPRLIFQRGLVAPVWPAPPRTAGIPNSYADVEIDEAVLREHYGWEPGVDASYEHEISPRELEVECEAEDCPPGDQTTFLE